MHWTGWIVVALAVFVGGWFVFDGVHAFARGDYVTPKSGRFAGQLGPWSHVVAAVGIAPRSTVMKTIFVVYGVTWLAIVVGFILGVRGAWLAMVIAAAGSLWYLPFGTLLGIVQLVLLILPPLRAG